MDDGAITEDFSSEDDELPPQASLTASKLENLDDALGNVNSHRHVPTQVNSDQQNKSFLESSVLREFVPDRPDRTPRKRMTQSTRVAAESRFVMPAMEGSSPSMSASSPQFARDRSSQPQTGLRRREKRTKTAATPSHAQDANTTDRSAADYLGTLWSNIVLPSLEYGFSILKIAASLAKPFIAYGLAIWLLLGLLIMARNLVTSSVSTALSPLCQIPGSSFLNLPFCGTFNNTSETGPVEFDKLVSAQAAFEEVLTTSAGGASLPLDMKRSEASIRDLKHVVQYSTLPSRNELVFEFTGFIDTARQASGDLSKYNSRIGRAVDRILTTNRWTLQVLDGIAESENKQGAVGRFVSNHLNVFAPFQGTPRLSQDVLFDQYIRHTSAIEEQIQSLILEAQALLQILQNLDDRLDLIAGIAMRDGIKAKDNADELFSLLWTKLGGNRSGVAKLEAQLNVLKDVGAYRRLAWAHVSGTIIKLQAIAANLEDLRERVARPEIVGIREEIPLEMHVREIVMGVERLEAVREEGRRVEGQKLQSILNRGERLGLDAV